MLPSFKVSILVVVVLGFLGLERLLVTRCTRNEKGADFVRRHPVLHPNGISVVRMPMGVVSIIFAACGWWSISILWFSFWMISDLTDGTIARNCDLVTESGKWLDPLSDKFMYFPALVYFAMPGVLRHPLPVVWVCAFLFIDAAGQFSRLLIKKKAANYFGKAKTALVTILLATLALDRLDPLWFMTPAFVNLLTVSCVILAFMSAYCKVIPDLWYANSLTLANFLCGLAAIWSVFDGHYLQAFVLVFVGQFFDLFDGRLARIYGSTRHGAMFDDVADATSFGVAIGYLIVRSLSGAAPQWVVLFTAIVYVGCTVFRLYRFLHPTVELASGTFQGMPAPAGAMLAGSGALLFGEDLPLVGLLLIYVTAALMVSSIRYRHFARRIWPELGRTMKLLVFILLLIFVNIAIANKDYARAFSLYCFVMGILYTLLGVDREVRRKREPQSAGQAS